MRRSRASLSGRQRRRTRSRPGLGVGGGSTLGKTPPASEFVSVWDTTKTSTGSSTSTQVKLPLTSSGTYNFAVDWGDDSSDTITTFDQAEVTHTYAESGVYQLRITGTIIGWVFANTGDRLKLTEVRRWGPLNPGNGIDKFRGAKNMVVSSSGQLDISGITDMHGMFQSADKFNQDISSWDVSAVTDMQTMFFGALEFNQPIGSWDVSNVTDMFGTFGFATSFNRPLDSWDVSNVTRMLQMFGDAHTFNQPLGSWDTSSLVNMSRMFEDSPFDQDISAWDVSSVTNMTDMFLPGATHPDTGLSTPNYDALLVGWEAQAVQNNVNFHGGNSQFSAGAPATARQALIDDHTWTITDGGQVS